MKMYMYKGRTWIPINRFKKMYAKEEMNDNYCI